MNLLEYTLEVLHQNRRTQRDVQFCLTSNGWFNWRDFVSKADIEFNRADDPVNPELQIIGKDFIMSWTINEDDQEWWFMELTPDKPDKYYKPISLLVR